MKLKKVIALLLASIMSVSILAACGSNNDDDPASSTESSGSSATTNNPVTSVDPPTENKSEGQLLAEQYGLPYTPLSEAEPITYTYFVRNPGATPSPDNPIINIIEKITNTKIEFETLVGDLETVISVMLASGDWNDMGFFGGEAGPFFEAGLALPLQDLIEQYAPNLRAHYAPWWELMKHKDGNIYAAEIYGTPVGKQSVLEYNGTAFWMQKDVLDHFGRAPQTLDEYFDFIREYKEIYPTIDGVPTIGFEILTEGWRRFCIDNPPGFLQGYGNWGRAQPDNQQDFDKVTGVSSRWTNEYNKKYYKKLNDEFQLGTISAETLTRTYDEYIATLNTGAVLGMCDQGWNFMYGATDPLRSENRFERTYLPLDLTYEGISPMYLDARAFTGNNGVIVNKNVKNPERIVQYWDYLIQEDVQRFLHWGIEGEHWFYNSEGRIERPEEERIAQQEVKYQHDFLGQYLWDQMPKMQGTFSDGNGIPREEQPEEYMAGLNEYDKALFDRLGIKTQTGLMRGEPAKWPAYYPYWSMALEDGTASQLADSRIDDTNQRYLSRLVICAPDQFDSIWNDYVSEMAMNNEEDLWAFTLEQSQMRLDAYNNN